ncbi:hypothetical protein PFICI_08652 [Pestalotiopsis fici W106-1]|uniref:DnaJ homologue subfamily C member 28 conserved domain-containing protein n=1 Tax=Pestalotiopsis fici (strain W106-1 / CGMCC3.15140) TaxID=1229662 RepID=W3WYF1_PESFW|nr:uncharacterized protein PFICI_08652 [Pestalotiopsis fici W106-1]ETS78799.1 hypothetical protein PFICI_08652 [Pestalotiopsis fici W106-1]
MAGIARSAHLFCSTCKTALVRREAALSVTTQRKRSNGDRVRHSSSASSTSGTSDATSNKQPEAANSGSPPPNNASTAAKKPEPGPMARRLEEATEEVLLTGGRAGRRAVEDAGFSEELKERLFAKVQDAKFRSDHAAAFAEADMPSSAGRGTAHLVSSEPWTGQESTGDAVLRMLDEARKPLAPGLRGKPRLPDLKPVDMRLAPRDTRTSGQRAAGARELAAAYTGMGLGREGEQQQQQNGLNEQEREAMRKEFRERFRPAARAMPNTITGLASLANERIEDAIARGQFKNIPRGKGIERDTRSDNPFIDTTEYIMNKMIKRQDMVPPWIEKQQELVKTAHTFRTRLRNDWKRHAARTIASKGGSVQAQMAKAQRYAEAEQVQNPRRRDVEQIAVPTNTTDDPVMAKLREQLATEMAAELADKDGTAEGAAAVAAITAAVTADSVISSKEGDIAADAPTATPQPVTTIDETPLPPPFRDPEWLRTEQTYMNLSIENLNTLTRSYNLMAPALAKKPYFSLERELNACYADVAPQLAAAIKERATRPFKPAAESVGHRPGGILDRFNGETHRSKIYDSKTPNYGFREMWRDLFRKEA